jgi:OOP family OmpA-OmpF porin
MDQRWGKWVFGLLCAASALVLSESARAQDEVEELAPEGNGDGFDTHLFRPAIDSKGFFYTNGSEILPANNVSFGFTLDYGRGIAPTNEDREDRGSKSLVQDSFQGTFKFNYGVAHVAVVGVAVPIVLMSTDEGHNGIGPTGDTYDTTQINTQKISNFAVHGKLRLTRVQRGPGVAVAFQAGLPVASAERNGAAEPGVWFWPRAILEGRLFQQKLRVGINGGYRGHTGEDAEFGLDDAGLTQLERGELQYGNLVTFGGALSYRVLPALDLVADTYGTYLVSDADQDQKLSQELLGGIKLFTDGQSYLFMGAGSRVQSGFEAANTRMVLGFVFEPSIGDRDGDGLLDDKDKCPDEPEDRDGWKDEDGCPDPDNDEDNIPDVEDRCPNQPEDFDGENDEDGCPETSLKDRDGDGILDMYDQCPEKKEDFDRYQDKDGCPDPDNDNDGIPDREDKCPLDAEDKDGFEDEDGCPELDNDNDRIPDSSDDCPNEPENYNGHQDDDGCPESGRVIVEGTELIILEKVQFATNSAEILPASGPVLDDVASMLEKHAEFQVVEVAGHADERGSDIHNLMLTKARAQAVLRALTERGIAQSRLVSQGYGEYCPLDPGQTAEAYEKNRRVEFKIVKKDGAVTDTDRGCRAARSKGVEPPPVQ